MFTNQNGRAIDSEEFYQLYLTLNELDSTLWVHPARTVNQPYYRGEEKEPYELWWTLMWPIETGMMMGRLAYSGIFQRCPNLNVVVHHAGGMIPMLAGRLENGLKLYGTRTAPQLRALTESPIRDKVQIDEFRRFTADTATFGSRAAIACAIDFYGVENMVFASDMPFDPEDGFGYVRRTLADIEALEITEEEKDAIRCKNALRILKLK